MEVSHTACNMSFDEIIDLTADFFCFLFARCLMGTLDFRL